MAHKLVLISGGTSASASTLIPRLIDAGYTCVATYRSVDEWRSVEQSINSDQIHGVQVDLLDAAAVEQVARRSAEQHGGLYGVIHLAGGFSGGSVEETSLDDWRKLLDRNLTSAFVVLHTCVPLLKQNGSGRIVTFGSSATLSPAAGLAAYNVAKSGVQMLTQSLAKELRGTGVTANCLLPGSLATPPMLKQMDRNKLVPLDRVADTILFLLSEGAASITGASIPLTGRA